MDGDPTIARIREARMRISEQFDHDPKQLVEHYMKLQERHKERVVRPLNIIEPEHKDGNQ